MIPAYSFVIVGRPKDHFYVGEVIEARTGKLTDTKIDTWPSNVRGTTPEWILAYIKIHNYKTYKALEAVRLIPDLEDPAKMWIVDTVGRITHYILWSTNGTKPAIAKGTCPTCGDRGSFIRMALTCPTHGVFGGC
jgi:hypothetical protein